MKRMFLLAAILSSATFLASCGGGGGSEESMTVAAEDLQVTVDETNGEELFQALESESFAYSEGVPAFETTTATTLDIVPARQGVGFRISSDGFTATGRMRGACRFDIRGSDYPDRLRVGTEAFVRDCLITIRTRNLPADGSVKEVRFTLTLNGRPAERTVKVRINANGTLVIRNVLFGTVKVRQVTGTGSF